MQQAKKRVMSQGQLLLRVCEHCGFTALRVHRQMVGACNYIEIFQIEVVHAEFSQHCCKTRFLTFSESLASTYMIKIEKRECHCIDLNERNLVIPKMIPVGEVERK